MAGGLAEDAGEINERKNNCYWSQEKTGDIVHILFFRRRKP